MRKGPPPGERGRAVSCSARAEARGGLRGAAALRDEAERGGGEQADAGRGRNVGAAGRTGAARAGAAGVAGGRRSGRNGGGHESDAADDESLLEHLCLLFARVHSSQIVELLAAEYVRRGGGAIAAEAHFPSVPQ